MLGTLLEKLSGLLSPGRVLSNLIPLVLFAWAVAFLVAAVDVRYEKAPLLFLGTEATVGQMALKSSVALAVLTIGAFVLSTLNTLLRELMEGRHWPHRIATALMARQREALDSLNDEVKQLRSEFRRLEKAGLPERLRDARRGGPKRNAWTYAPEGSAAREIERLRRRRSRGEAPAVDELLTVCEQLADDLLNFPMSKGDPDSRRLDRDHTDLVRLVRFAIDWRRREALRLYNERQVRFGVGSETETAALAPTAMGNLAESLRAYADSRYLMAFDVFWPRLQKILQQQKDFYGVLQDAKVQVDFFVSLFWLAAAFTAFAFAYLTLVSHTIGIYLTSVLSGLSVCFFSYRLAVVNYRAFTELVRAALDLHRIDLLEALEAGRPAGSAQERRTWEALNRHISYGELTEFPYENEAQR